MSRVAHFEIHADDPARAITFYENVFGWQFSKWEGPMEYWMVKTGEPEVAGIDGGLMKRMGGAPIDGQAVNSYVCTIMSSTVDSDINKAITNGGSIAVPKMAVPGIGWLAYIKDTEGNLFGVMQEDGNAA